MSTPIFDAIATELGVLCPICGYAEITRGLAGSDDRGGDLDVCWECWMRGLHMPEVRAERTCVDCGKYCWDFDAMMLVIADGVIPLCRADYERRGA